MGNWSCHGNVNMIEHAFRLRWHLRRDRAMEEEPPATDEEDDYTGYCKYSPEGVATPGERAADECSLRLKITRPRFCLNKGPPSH